MLFNSLDFAVFFPIVFMLYWLVFNKSLGMQNVFILMVSYLFYGWWDWRFLFLIAFSSCVDFLVSRRMDISTDERSRKHLLWLSLGVNLGLLGFFKYFNFFSESFAEAFTLFGQQLYPYTLKIILPVGISFYTFQTLSYTIDVYHRRLKPTDDVLKFFAFVSFFPQLVAGPIERAKDLLPQFYQKREFNYTNSVDGLRQILMGLFKKVVIADNCAPIVNQIFDNYTDYSGGVLILGAVFFAFQIYGDFSGYSDIAIGIGRMLGFRLTQNFAYPYFSRDIAEFWRRWHISLSSWFKDYVYIPLGGSKGGKWMNIRNVFIIFLVSGFWHGANWTFIAWGGVNALLFLPLLLSNRNRKNTGVISADRMLPSLREAFQIALTFTLVSITWIFFRADDLSSAIGYLQRILTTPFFESSLLAVVKPVKLFFIPLIFLLVVLEWVGKNDQHALETLGLTWPRIGRWGVYTVISLSLVIFSSNEQEFIYFQF
jgi:alginate O-acetyltransferase complex protein AlgI